VGKHLDIFNRRVLKGQCYHRPYLGCREFPAFFEPAASEAAATPPPADRDLGWMLHDIDFADGMTARFFRAELKDGVVEVPAPDSPEVAA